MDIKDFIGKVVIHRETKKRYLISEIHASYIDVKSEKPNSSGHYSTYRWGSINGDAISNGDLILEEEHLTEEFKNAYNAHCRSKKGYYEDIGYWMRKG